MGEYAGVRKYVSPTVTTFDSSAVREMLGPVETQYTMTVTATSCLPLDLTGSTTQDNWQFAISGDPTRVNIDVDVTANNAACALQSTCDTPPDASMGPLDPKFAIYPPGVAPATGVFNGYYSAADCSAVDPGCPTKPANACIVCDNSPCALAGTAPNSCGSLDVTLSPAGIWTIAVAPQAPSFVAQGQGCYVLTLNGLTGQVAPVPAPWAPTQDDGIVTFLRTAPRK